MTPRWDRPPQQEIRTRCCLHAQCKSIKDGEKLPCNCILWPMSSTTTISGTVGNILNYRSTTAKMSSRLNVAGFFLFLCFVLLRFFGFFSVRKATSQPAMHGCWVLGDWLPQTHWMGCSSPGPFLFFTLCHSWKHVDRKCQSVIIYKSG